MGSKPSLHTLLPCQRRYWSSGPLLHTCTTRLSCGLQSSLWCTLGAVPHGQREGRGGIDQSMDPRSLSHSLGQMPNYSLPHTPDQSLLQGTTKSPSALAVLHSQIPLELIHQDSGTVQEAAIGFPGLPVLTHSNRPHLREQKAICPFYGTAH